VVKGSPNAFTIALKPSGPRKWAYTTKKDGSVYQTGTNSVSDDGKVMTITFTGVSAQGKTPSGTMVFDKQ
jgi:hypothetical protein